MSDSNMQNEFNDDKINQLYQRGANDNTPASLTAQVLRQSRLQNRQDRGLIQRLLDTLLSPQLALAAVAIIGISIILQIQFDQPEELISPAADRELQQQLNQTSAITPSRSVAKPAPDSVQTDEQPILAPQPLTSEETKQRQDKSEAARKQVLSSKQESETRIRLELEKRKLAEQRSMVQNFAATPAPRSAPAEDSVADSVASTESPQPEIASGSVFMPAEENCTDLSQAACLNATGCTLVYDNKSLLCRNADNSCEANFSQANDSKEKCLQREVCDYIESACECDSSETCRCTNNIAPGCYRDKKN